MGKSTVKTVASKTGMERISIEVTGPLTPRESERLIAKIYEQFPNMLKHPQREMRWRIDELIRSRAREADIPPDKDPLPEPSLRNEIDELRRRVTHLEELIVIV